MTTCSHGAGTDSGQAGRLPPILSGRPCFVGGNCQAAHIACAIAAHILAQAQPVLGLLSIDAENLLPLPLPYAVLFGEFSKEFNPCLRGTSLFPLWHRAFREVSPRTLPAGHGEYFMAPSLPVLAAHVSSFIDHYQRRSIPSQAWRRQNALGDVISLPSQLRTGQTVFVSLPSSHPRSTVKSTDILARWHDHQNPSLILRTHLVRSDTADAEGFDLLAPDTPSLWELQLFRCQSGIGPVCWSVDIGQSRLIQLASD